MSDFETTLMSSLYELRRALCRMSAVFEEGKVKHLHNDGFLQPPSFHIERAKRHLELMTVGGKIDLRHLEHACW